MKDQVINKLNQIIEKYRSMPDTGFLLYEAYIDNGQTDISYIFEIKDYDEEEAKKPLLEEGMSVKDRKVMVKRLTNLSSVLRPEKKYCILNGKDIALRAERLKNFLESKYIQPPGVLKDGSPHFGMDISGYKSGETKDADARNIENISCQNFRSCTIQEWCPQQNKIQLNGLRYTGNRLSDTKSLQAVLHKFQYSDEMNGDKYKLDGIYDQRTKLAVHNFISELNYSEQLNYESAKKENETLKKIKFEPESGEYIGIALDAEIKKKCEQNWQRKKYYFFKDQQWDMFYGMQGNDEISLAKWKYHVRMLQQDLTKFTVTRMKYLPLSGRENILNENLDTLWQPGVFDNWTERSVMQFQEAALCGSRYDPLIQELTTPFADKPTYHGQINGIVDLETKQEIERWFQYIEGIEQISGFNIDDNASPAKVLSGMKIITPSLACCSLAKEKASFQINLAVPKEIEGQPVTAADIRLNLKYSLFLHQPIDRKRPFLADTFKPGRMYEDKYSVLKVEAFDKRAGRFYEGTAQSLPEGDENKALFIDSPLESGIKKGLSDELLWETNYEYRELVKTKIWNIYDRKYPGLLEKLKQANLTVWTVTLQLEEGVEPGIYLLKLKDSDDLKPHPLRIFPQSKTDYTIAHLTDLHIAKRYDELPGFIDSTGYNNPNDRLRDFIKRIKHLQPDFVVITGDVIDYANNHRPYDSKNGEYIFKPVIDKDANWRRLHRILTSDPGINVPFYITLGNHDFKPNPAAVSHMAVDLNISAREAANYPYDLWDTAPYLHVAGNWLTAKCYGDVLYADENSVEYYYENFCPFSDFSVSIDNLNLILMNSGVDNKIFLNQYTNNLTEAIEYLGQLFSGECPAPVSVGFSQDQLTWLQDVLESKPDCYHIFCMHNPVINPAVTDLKLKETTVPASAEVPPGLDVSGEDRLVELYGILKYEGWGRQDIMEREAWLTKATADKLKMLSPENNRHWLPCSEKEISFIKEKIKLVEMIIQDASDYFLNSIPSWPNDPIYWLPPEWLPETKEKYEHLIKELKFLKSQLEALLQLDVSSIASGRKELLSFLEQGKIRLVLSGHSHKNMEIRCATENGAARWYIGNYSSYPENLDYFNSQRNTLVLSTISAGMAGHGYTFDKDKNDIVKEYGICGYRLIKLNTSGMISSFQSQILWSKNGTADSWENTPAASGGI
ncbi:MAG: metallophosphoesterase family protein [Desulfosporosinus sp.]